MGVKYSLYKLCKPLFLKIYNTLGIERKIHDRLVSIDDIPPAIEFALVPGAKIEYEVCKILKKRLDLAIEVYHKYSEIKFILSGTPKISKFNSDVDVMQEYMLVHSSINPNQIVLDYEGTTTFNSFRSFKNKGYIGKVLVITNQFHMARALYIAIELGIDAYGLKYDDESSDAKNSKTLKSKIFLCDREVVATFKAFIQCKLYKIRGK